MQQRDFKLYLVFLFIWVVFSYPFFLQGKVAAPLDFLVNFYAPWDAYFDAPIKNSAISDVVSQIIPWKIFNADELKNGRIPLWNPYNLAGTPHLGNWQSGVLYPTTLLFLIFPVQIAWSLHILLQPLMAGIFMILFLRLLKLSNTASLIGALSFAYGGFMTTWFEWGTLGHALVWLPLALYGIEKTRNNEQKTMTIFALTMSLFAGHPQTSIYVILVTIGYFLYRNFGDLNIRQKILYPFSFFLFPLLLAAPQVLPAFQVYLNSARTLVDGTSWARAFLIPVSGLLTFLAPDFFGNPVTRNSWSNFSYVEMQGYIGVATLVLAIFAIKEEGRRKKEEDYRSNGIAGFLLVLIVLSLLLVTNNPVSNWIISMNLPIFSSSSPARLMGLIDFSLAVLAALGLDRLAAVIKVMRPTKAIYGSFLAIAMILVTMWLWTFVSNNPNVLISRRNLIFPSAVLAVFIIVYFLISKTFANRRIWSLLIVFCSLFIIFFDLFRFHHKFTPYADASMWYPKLPVLAEFEKLQGRSFGLLDGNLNLPLRIYSLDGYDPMISVEYVKLTYPNEELVNRNRIVGPHLPKGRPETIDLVSRLGGKWFVDSSTPGSASWDLKLWEYGGQFQQVWKDVKYQILYNTSATNEVVEPLGWMKKQQYRLFKLGLAVAGVTMIGTVILRPKAEESRRGL